MKTYLLTLISNLNLCHKLDRISWSGYVYRSNIVSHRCEFESLRWPSRRAKLDRISYQCYSGRIVTCFSYFWFIIYPFKSFLTHCRNSRNEKYRQPQDRVENFDTSSNHLPSASSKKPLKNENRFNNYQQSQQQSFDTKPNMTERQPKPATFTNNRAWNERESSSSNKCQVVKDEDDDDDLLLNIDLQKLEKTAQKPVLSNNINVANRRNDPASTKIKRMPSEEICFIEKTNTFRETVLEKL